jgi:GDP-L-fucose synthase
MTNRTLITGGGGLVGSALTEHLRSEGHEVICLSSRSQCDLTNSSEVEAVFKFTKPDQVHHLAASVFGVGGNLAFPGEIYYRNALMNTHVVEACRKFEVKKIVAMGSAAMYSDGLSQPMNEDDVMHGEPHGSEFAYAYSKRAMLAQLKAYRQQYGLEYAFVVATNMYGAKDRFDTNYGHVVPSLLKKFLDAESSGNTVEIWGDGSPTRDFLYSIDAAVGLQCMMEKGNGVFNLASGSVYSIRDLVLEIALNFPSVSYQWDTSKPLGQLRRAYDTSKLRNLGFNPSFSLSEGIKLTIAWLRKNDSVVSIKN